MKQLSTYIKEKLIINKDYHDNKIVVKSFDELRKIIEDRYDKLGPGTENDPIDFYSFRGNELLFDFNFSTNDLFVRGKRILNSDECKEAFKYGSFQDIHPLYKIILKTRCFFLVWLFHWAVKLKHWLVGKNTYAKR